MDKFGHGTPDDWIEHKLYTPHFGKGIILMLAIDLLLFGPAGLSIWAVQMVWIPFWAPGSSMAWATGGVIAISRTKMPPPIFSLGHHRGW
jgi:fatty-acid desaturase